MTQPRNPKLCCLLGDPVEHSLSPLMFNSAFRTTGDDIAYLAFQVKAEDLGSAIEGLKALGFIGCNVTIPHKTTVVKLLGSMDRSAEISGSVNVIRNENGKLVGYSTDGSGALKAMAAAGIVPIGKRIQLLGYGGVARAVAFELAQRAKPKEIMIAGRDLPKAASLAEDIQPLVNAEAVPLDQAGGPQVDILINCTPVGMWPKVNESPIRKESLESSTVVFDLVYNPAETLLLKLAKDRGCRTLGGLEMLVQQGAMAFELWLGKKAPVDIMRKAAEEGLKE
ncbi:MAG: shikimate dehydrogenase [Candidatus Methanomethylicus sp.]|nr:shikimate dehydrogenase [Candidatus Methanomethylicus sp.]